MPRSNIWNLTKLSLNDFSIFRHFLLFIYLLDDRKICYFILLFSTLKLNFNYYTSTSFYFKNYRKECWTNISFPLPIICGKLQQSLNRKKTPFCTNNTFTEIPKCISLYGKVKIKTCNDFCLYVGECNKTSLPNLNLKICFKFSLLIKIKLKKNISRNIYKRIFQF